VSSVVRPTKEGVPVSVGGRPLPNEPDLPRMRRERHTKLQEQLELHGLDAMMLLGTSAVSYATGAATPGADSSRAALLRPVAIVVRDDAAPHLFTPYPEGVPHELPADHVHGPLYPDLDEGAAVLARALADVVAGRPRVAVDELTHPMDRALAGVDLVAATPVLAAAKLHKTADELACIRTAQHINELAMAHVQPALRPGVAQTALSARFLRQIFEHGADMNGIDPIWQAMSPTKAAGPWTTNGDIAFPPPSADRVLEDGDVVWVDSGIHYAGYASDFGRTWIVADDARPTPRQRAQFIRWREVVGAVLDVTKPGATALELDRAAIAANAGTKPWMDHFYLAHGIGTDSAEMPLIGTDLGEAFDDQLVLEPGMVLVVEPAIWDDGAAGYRAEEILAITDDGWVQLSDYPYEPYDVPT
jgi:Xaa-Pro dipeptidase